MELNANINLSIHNRFDIISRDIRTGEIEKAQAENIVLDRIYTRLCAFATYFDQIVYGSGTGTPTVGRTTLFNRIGNKAATTEQLIRAYPTSQWTRSIRLGTSDNNGQMIREVGISNTTTNINTHALITDSEGNPIELEKTEFKIIDIYATVFVTIYDVDWGLKFVGNGLRDYLTGNSMAAERIGLSQFELMGHPDWLYLTSTRTNNVAEKTVQTYARFNVQHYNKEVRYIYWDNTGLRCQIPRIGVFEGMQKNNIAIGTGDGERVSFRLPQNWVKDRTIYIDGTPTTDYTVSAVGAIVFDNPPPLSSTITADYTCELIPKDENHVLDITMKLAFGGSQPSPVMPPEPDPEPIDPPGSSVLIGGDSNYGFYGEVPVSELLSGDELCELLGLTAGVSQNSDEPWLKFALDGKMLYVAKKTYRHSVSWNHINAVGAVFGEFVLNKAFKVRLLSTEEWDALMYPIHTSHPSGAPNWANYSDIDINVNTSSGNGRATWTSTPSGASRVYRGGDGVTSSGGVGPASAGGDFGFRPVLEIL